MFPFLKPQQFLATLLAAALVAAAGPVAAQGQSDAGWYIGGAYGMTSFDLDTTGITNPSLDDSDSGFKIYGGFQFNKHLGAEVGYVDFGKASISGSLSGIPFTGNIDVTAFTFAGVGTLPLNESFALFGKVGLWTWDATANVSALGSAGSADDSGTDVFFGVGARYNLNKNFALTLEVEMYDSDDSVTMTSLGVRYQF
jgi:OOP family OmpA-OmpF porin